MNENLNRLAELYKGYQKKNIRKMKDIKKILNTSNKNLSTVVSTLAEIGKNTEVPFSNMKCIGFFKQPQTKENSQEEENSNQNTTSTKSKKDADKK